MSSPIYGPRARNQLHPGAFPFEAFDKTLEVRRRTKKRPGSLLLGLDALGVSPLVERTPSVEANIC